MKHRIALVGTDHRVSLTPMHPRAPYPFEAPSRPHPFLRPLRTPPALAPSVPLVAALSLFGDAAPLRPPPQPLFLHMRIGALPLLAVAARLSRMRGATPASSRRIGTSSGCRKWRHAASGLTPPAPSSASIPAVGVGAGPWGRGERGDSGLVRRGALRGLGGSGGGSVCRWLCPQRGGVTQTVPIGQRGPSVFPSSHLPFFLTAALCVSRAGGWDRGRVRAVGQRKAAGDGAEQ